MKSGPGSFISTAVGLALGLPSLGILYFWAQDPFLFPSTPVEGAVLSAILLRAAIYLVFPRVRRMRPSNLVVFFSVDIMLLPILIGADLLTGYAQFGDLAGAYLGGWFSAALVVYPVVATVAIADAVRRGSRLATVVPGAAGMFALAAAVFARVAGASEGDGLSSVVRMTFNVGKATAAAPWTSTPILLCGGLLFASLAAYSLTIGRWHGRNFSPGLVVGAVAFAALFGWVQLVPDVQPWAAYVAPSTVAVGLVWGLTRER